MARSFGSSGLLRPVQVVEFEDDGGRPRQRRGGDPCPAGQTARRRRASAAGQFAHAASLDSTGNRPARDRGRLLFGEHHGDLLFEFRRLEAERAPAPFVRDLSRSVDEIQPVGHSAVKVADAVVDLVHDQRHRHLRALHSTCEATSFRSSSVVG